MDYLTRDQISDKLCNEGFDVSTRTLRFWESEDMMPSASLIDGRALHKPSALAIARALAATRPKALAELRRNGSKHVQIVKMTEDEIVLRISYQKENKNG